MTNIEQESDKTTSQSLEHNQHLDRAWHDMCTGKAGGYPKAVIKDVRLNNWLAGRYDVDPSVIKAMARLAYEGITSERFASWTDAQAHSKKLVNDAKPYIKNAAKLDMSTLKEGVEIRS